MAALVSTSQIQSAQAFATEGNFWGGAGGANINFAAPTASGWWGPLISGGLVINLDDFWRLNADIAASHHFERDDEGEMLGPHTVISTALGVRYALDIITYVPYLGIAVVAHPLGAPSSTAPEGELFSMRATVGVDYRKSRRFSFGGTINLHAPLTQPADFPHYSTIQLHIGYHFRRF